VAIRLAIEGDLRFISHHDCVRVFERAIARAGLPVKFSEGFNPRPRISLPLPRAVGIATQADVLVIELAGPLDASTVLQQLSRQMPQHLRLLDAWLLEGSGALAPQTVEYELPLAPELSAGAASKVRELLAGSQWTVQRTGDRDKRDGQIDLRPFLVSACVEDDVLRWTARVTDSGSIRPAELIAAAGLDPREWQHRVIRRSVQWSQQPACEVLAAVGAPDD
jgi:radical SAM-linked protein